MADDYSASISTTGKLAVGGSAVGVIETGNDYDWFRISLTAGTTYVFSASGTASSDTLSNFGNVSFSLYNAQGVIASYGANYATAKGAVGQFQVQASGTYFVSMGSYYTGSYTLKATTPAADDYSANAQTTATLQDGATLNGVFERTDDIDWIRFHAEAGQVVSFTAAGVAADSSSYYNGSVYDASGSYQSSMGLTPFIAAASGDYYLALSANGRLGAYSETMQLIADDYANDNSSSAQLYAGGQLSGRIDYYADADRFKISLEAGHIYTLTVKPNGAGTAAPALAMYLPSGSYDYDNAATSTASDGSVTLRYQASVTGVYGINLSGTAVQSYVLSASFGELDDYGNTVTTATSLALGQSVSGKIQSTRDIDMFQVDLKAGVTYNFDLTGDSAQSGSSLSSQLLNASGQSLATVGYNGHYSYTPTKDGSYYLSQSSYRASADSVDFTLTASVADDDFGANSATPGRLSVGGATKGMIENGGDRDWFAVSLNAGGYYWFKLEGAAEGGGTLASAANVSFKLLDSSGNLLASMPSYSYGTGVTVPFTAPTKGTYYVEVGTASGSTGGSYTVRAQLGKADDYGSDQAHAAAMAPDTLRKGELELSSDKDVFKLSVVAGMTYSVELAPQSGTNYYALNLDVSGPGYLNVRYVSSADKVVRVFEAATSGDYYVTVGTSPSYNWTGAYTVVANSMGIDDFSADSKTSAVISPDAPLHGTIGVADDHDWIKVHLDAGRSYVFDLSGNKSGGGTLDSGNQYGSTGMNLLTANGSSVAYSSVPDALGGSDPRIRYTATTSGDYYLDVHGSGQSGGTGSYTVVEVQANLDTTGPKLLAASVGTGAVDVALKTPFTLTFDETIMLSGAITLTDGYGTVVQSSNSQPQASVVGHTLTIDPHANLMPGMTYTVNLPQGSVIDLVGNSAGAQSFSFTTVKPVVAGTAGNDYLIGSGNGLTLDGGAGTDTVYYASARNYFSISRGSDGSALVRDYRTGSVGNPGGDKLAGVERLLFNDGAYALDIDGVAGQAYRLYQGAFNRAPDADGLGFWISRLDHGMSLKDVASGFLDSPEFIRTYGSATSDADLVKLMYQNVLHRAPDAEGNSMWLAQLKSGAISRAELLVNFSESPENHDAIAKLIGNGFSYTYAG